MTLVQSKERKTFLHLLTVILFAFLFLEAASLVMLYNRVLNMHSVRDEIKLQIQSLETQSSELKDKIFKLTTSGNLKEIAVNMNLVEEKHPEYFEIDRVWGEFVSRY